MMPSVSLPCLQDLALVFTACQNRALQERHHALVPSQVPPTPHPVFGKPTYTLSPQQTRSLDPASPLLSSHTLFWVPDIWGNRNGNPVLNRAPDLWEHTPALCVHQFSRKNESHRHIFNEGPPPSLGKRRPSGAPNPSTDPACYPPLSGTSDGHGHPPASQETGKEG